MIKKSNTYDFIQYASSLPYWERRIAIARSVIPGQRRFLYKYRPIRSDDNVSIARLRDIIVEGRLWMSSPLDFNDPFDMSMKLVVRGTRNEKKERFKELVKDQGVPRNERGRVVREFAKKSRRELEQYLADGNLRALKKFGVYSFAGDPRSILMWSHYAQDHTGVCVQFERVRDYINLAKALRVKYSAEYPEVNWVKDFSETLGMVMFRKHKGWEYELEERTVKDDGARQYIQIDPAAITGIIFGCRATDKNRDPVIQLLKEREKKSLPAPKLYVARQHKSMYRLCIFSDTSAN